MLNRLESNRQSVCASAACECSRQLAAEGQWQGNYGVTWAQSVCRRPPSWKGVFPLISLTRGEAPSANGRLKFITGVSAAIMLPWIAGCKKVLTGAAGHQRVMKRKQNSWRKQTESSTGEKMEDQSPCGGGRDCSHCSPPLSVCLCGKNLIKVKKSVVFFVMELCSNTKGLGCLSRTTMPTFPAAYWQTHNKCGWKKWNQNLDSKFYIITLWGDFNVTAGHYTHGTVFYCLPSAAS